jgi:signal transduction histidine kinase
LLSSQQIARQSASAAIRMLGGEAPSNIKVPVVETSAAIFDWRELQRWNINESLLPAGSDIQFRSPTAWEQYRMQIIAICAALLVQTALIVGLIYEQRRRHRAEILARNSMSELTDMNRRATAGELSASIAHEVKQPLAAISSNGSAALRWLTKATPDLAEARKAMERVVDAAHHAGDIVDTIRSMFRKDAGERTVIDINHVIMNVVAVLRTDLQKNGVELRILLDPQLPAIKGNSVQLQQVVLNLVVNAIESMREVQSRVLRVQSDKSSSDMVHVSVEDTGTGVDPANLDRLFKPLFTTKKSGMGIGLSICHSIIEAHEGRIWVTAGPEKGSVFQFELPTS